MRSTGRRQRECLTRSLLKFTVVTLIRDKDHHIAPRFPISAGGHQHLTSMKTVTIFGSSLPGEGTQMYQQARQLGGRLAQAGFAVCNGGYGGLMEASARGARECGGYTIGV